MHVKSDISITVKIMSYKECKVYANRLADRMLVSDEKAIYHVMSRTALDGFPLADAEKDFLLGLIKRRGSILLKCWTLA